MATVAIAGGGLVGLTTALMLARRGHEVVVVDRDEPPPPGTPDEVAAWRRPGVPQALHPHVFLARSTRVLREALPDVLDRLLDAGVTRSGRRFGEGYEEDTDLRSRRLVYEDVVRRVAASEPGIELVTGHQLDGLVATPDRQPRVRGLRTVDGRVFEADVVVDAMGRRSPSPRWLRALGAAAPLEERHPCGLHYFARHYRVLPGSEPPIGPSPPRVVLPFAVFLAFGGDNGTFSFGGGLSTTDPLRSELRRPEVFDRVIGAIPTFRDLLEESEPASEVHLMGSLANRRRRLVVDGVPRATGYVLVGDASIYTNATLGQGTSLGFWQAQQLAGLMDGGPAPDIAVRLEAWTDEVLGPRFAFQATIDARQAEQLRAGLSGDLPAPPPPGMREILALSRLAEEDDPVVAPATARVGHLLWTVEQLMTDREVRSRLDTFLATEPDLTPREGPLSRAEFEALAR